MFQKILIANRGEIALRILRTCHAMGIRVVAVYSTADSDAMHVRLADESVCIGPPSAAGSYLHIPAIISAAEITGVDAIHPGIGFLAENPSFARIVAEHKLTFIGPIAEHIRLMGDKTLARGRMEDAGMPVLPGSSYIAGEAEAKEVAQRIGYPVLLKAAAGGGGRGIKIVREPSELQEMLALARAEAQAAFGDDRVYVEKFLTHPRHIEVQVLGDGRGDAIHLGERDCSIQRRHQKLLEETPSPDLDAALREHLCAASVEVAKSLQYRGVGTIEMLCEDGRFYFLEMNTRLQVEHTITEMVTGIDLVREQIQIAYGAGISPQARNAVIRGHAIECRINAEDPVNFTPSPGQVTAWHPAGGLGIRIDSALFQGYRIPPFYDSLAAKTISWGQDREEAIMRMKGALNELIIDGVPTTLPLHQEVLDHSDFRDGRYDISWLERFMEQRRSGG